MVNPFTLPALAGSLLAAVALGIHLGESAIGLIDPVHLQGPALHPRDRGAAIDPNAIRPRSPAFADLYGWDEGEAARAAALSPDCGGCDALVVRDRYAYTAVVPYFGGGAEPDVESSPPVVEPLPEPKPRVHRPQRDVPIARYASYPVEIEEEAREVPYYAANDVYLPPVEEPEAARDPRAGE